MIRAHQPGSLPIDVPETIPNPAVPETTPGPTKPIPQEPVKTPEKVPANYAPVYAVRAPRVQPEKEGRPRALPQDL